MPTKDEQQEGSLQISEQGLVGKRSTGVLSEASRGTLLLVSSRCFSNLPSGPCICSLHVTKAQLHTQETAHAKGKEPKRKIIFDSWRCGVSIPVPLAC